MAENTDARLQNQIIYSVYVRAHTEEGTFLSIVPDLDRIRALGADWIWFMPIHPIGVKGKKGSLGCPYANRDYRLAEHPEFYWRDAEGNTGNKIGDWADVIDLDYRKSALWDYQIESLKMWARIVDGFRCDVAPFVPVEFWKRARAAVGEVNPDCVWLAESVHLSFGNYVRREGFPCTRDTELYEAFDLEYQYDIWESFERFLEGKALLHEFCEQLNFQEAVYPENYNKLRYLENHDQKRIASRVKDEGALDNYTAMLYFLKGTTLLYAGQEFSCTHTPSLFEKEVFPRTGRDLSALLARLARFKKACLGGGFFVARADDERAIAVMERSGIGFRAVGVFSLRGERGPVRVEAPDGEYPEWVRGGRVLVKNGQILCTGEPIIFTLPR